MRKLGTSRLLVVQPYYFGQTTYMQFPTKARIADSLIKKPVERGYCKFLVG